jgi:hypothetical protein
MKESNSNQVAEVTTISSKKCYEVPASIESPEMTLDISGRFQ